MKIYWFKEQIRGTNNCLEIKTSIDEMLPSPQTSGAIRSNVRTFWMSRPLDPGILSWRPHITSQHHYLHPHTILLDVINPKSYCDILESITISNPFFLSSGSFQSKLLLWQLTQARSCLRTCVNCHRESFFRPESSPYGPHSHHFPMTFMPIFARVSSPQWSIWTLNI